MAYFKFIHLSDSHLPPRGARLYGLCPAERLAQAVDAINQRHYDAAMVVITGDLVHWGDRTAYDELSEVLAKLAVPVRLLAGNHDDRTHFAQAFPSQFDHEFGFVQGTADLDIGRFIFLDTVIDGRSGGEICATRLDWLAARLAESTGDCYLFAHHPPFDLGIAAMDRIKLAGAEAFWEIIEPHKARIRHLFFGHIHRTISGSWRGIPWSTVKGMAHQVDLDLSNQSLDRGVIGTYEAPSFGVVLVGEDVVLVHSDEFTYAGPRFPLLARDGDQRDYALSLVP